ncbi:MAG: CapA family protein [Lachnospiraceae bacterium]|nr:CapA family protein [Lachnospiraceae bacterium]
MPDDNPADDKTEISSQSGMTGPDNPETDKDESEPEEDDTISLIMVGDILLHIPVDASAKREDGTYDFNAIFSETKDDIEKADLALVNQEVIIGGEELGVSGYPAFNAPYEIADALVDNGFDVILHATNHALDKGKKGIQNCTANWEEKYPDIAYIGIAANEEKADEIYIYEDKGIKIAILNYTYGTNGIPLPSDMPYAVNLLKESRVKEDIQRAEELADFTIVCPHWGIEYSLETSAEQEKWAKLFLENGVDLVIGTHPHVIEPIEIYERENGEKMLVYYSLGNYVNWTSGTGAKVSKRMLGGMAKVTVGRDEDGKVVIEDYGVEALVCDLHKGEDGVKVYPLSEYSEEMAAENAIVRQADGFSYEYLVSLCNDIWGEMWE